MTKPVQRAANSKKSQVEDSPISSVSSAFMENNAFLKNFLKRFFSRAEDIEDVAQEAYLKAYHAEQESGVDQPKAYLFRVAKNIALNELNRKSHQMTVYIEDRLASIPLDGKDNPEDELEAKQSVRLYYEAVEALPKKCRRVFLLRKVNGMRHQDIADHLGITISAVEKHLRNGTKSCRAYINRANQTGGESGQEKTQDWSQGGLK
jgi:RNA polymerase sigma factor (sigma-70 family)